MIMSCSVTPRAVQCKTITTKTVCKDNIHSVMTLNTIYDIPPRGGGGGKIKHFTPFQTKLPICTPRPCAAFPENLKKIYSDTVTPQTMRSHGA